MTQPSLLDLPQPRPRKAGHVPRSSVLAGQSVERDTRMVNVILALVDCEEPPTSAELAARMVGPDATLSDVLTARRGLSDALAKGYVEHAGQRVCRVSNRHCLLWRTKGR